MQRKIYVSDPWILKQYLSEKPSLCAQKAEYLIINKVNQYGANVCHFTYDELKILCQEQNLDYQQIFEAMRELSDVKYNINYIPVKPYKKVEFREDGIYIKLSQKIVNHYYNPLALLEL